MTGSVIVSEENSEDTSLKKNNKITKSELVSVFNQHAQTNIMSQAILQITPSIMPKKDQIDLIEEMLQYHKQFAEKTFNTKHGFKNKETEQKKSYSIPNACNNNAVKNCL